MHFKGRPFGFFGLKGFPVEFVRELLLVETGIFTQIEGKNVRVWPFEVLLVNHRPVDCKLANTCILDAESLLDCGRIRDNGRHWKTDGNCVVIEAHLIGWNNHWTAADCNSHREILLRKSFHIGINHVVKLAANVIVDGNFDWYF